MTNTDRPTRQEIDKLHRDCIDRVLDLEIRRRDVAGPVATSKDVERYKRALNAYADAATAFNDALDRYKGDA